MKNPLPCLAVALLLHATPRLPAAPVLTVSELGLNPASNREWLVEVAPDPSLFVGGRGAIGLELAFTISGSDLLGALANTAAWPFNNPGLNPFTGSVTFGVTLDLTADTVFAALGSDPFTNGEPVEVLTIETLGGGPTMLSWDGLIAQAGMTFQGYTGMLASSAATGDFNRDGRWDCQDINPLSQAIAAGSSNLGYDMNADGLVTLTDITDPTRGWLTMGGANNPAQTGGRPFLNGDANLSGGVDGSDFGVWNSRKFSANSLWCDGDFNASGGVDGSDFGIWNASKFRSSDGLSPVPEPHALTWMIAILALARPRALRTYPKTVARRASEGPPGLRCGLPKTVWGLVLTRRTR